MSLATVGKITAILVVAVGMYFGLKHPTTQGDKSNKRREVGKAKDKPTVVDRGRFLVFAAYKSVVWTHAVVELVILCAPTGVTSFLLPGDEDASCIFLSPLALFSAALVAFGCVVRQLCFREMGRRFTYHLTIVENHTPVTTGPYNIVWHPSYIGV